MKTKTMKISVTIPTHIMQRVDAYAVAMGVSRSRAIADMLWHIEVTQALEVSK